MVAEIVQFLETQTEITDILWDRLYYGIPDEVQTGIYATFNKVWHNENTIERRDRIEIKIFWVSWTSYDTLTSIEKKIFEALRYYRENWVYKIINSNSFNGYSEEGNKMVMRDILVYYTY